MNLGEALLESAIDIAERAGNLALSYFRQKILIEMKENMTPVTVADKKTEEFIRHEIAQRYSEHGILGEEFENSGLDREFVWTIDPIDGTRSFIRGIPLWGTLLGLLHRGEPVLGVMALPALDEVYSAAQGLGAFCNGVQIHASTVQTMEKSIVSVGDVTCFETAGRAQMLKSLQDKAELCRGYTDCFGHAMVARGAVDMMIDPLVSIWDVAPLAAIVTEAGGDYFDLETGERTIRGKSFVTCNGFLRQEILSHI
jgi:histidinol-phosphatase